MQTPANAVLTIDPHGVNAYSIQWETFTPTFRTMVTGMPQRYPLQLTVPSHGIENGQKVMIVGCKGIESVCGNEPEHFNIANYHHVTAVDANTIEFQDLRVPENRYYRGGGFVQFGRYMDLTGCTAQLDIFDQTTAPVWLTIPATVDVPNHQITVSLTATQRDAFIAQYPKTLKAYYKITVFNSLGDAFPLCLGIIQAIKG